MGLMGLKTASLAVRALFVAGAGLLGVFTVLVLFFLFVKVMQSERFSGETE